MKQSGRFLYKNEQQIAEFITALKGRKEAPLKFEYIGKGANRWDRIVRSKEYSLGKIETDLIKRNIDKIIFLLKGKNFNIIDIGCGNGMKGLLFIKKFLRFYRPVNYLGLDISGEMIVLALSNIKKHTQGGVRAKGALVDFEAGNFARTTRRQRKQGDSNNLLLLLGHTLGNPSDKNRVLMNIRESMIMSDLLFIGVEYLDIDKVASILKHYQNKAVQDILFGGLEAVGFRKNDGYFEVVYNKKEHQIETQFVFMHDKAIAFHGEDICFKKGDKILLMISTKFTEQGIRKLLAQTGFRVIDTLFDKRDHYALIVCAPKPLA